MNNLVRVVMMAMATLFFVAGAAHAEFGTNTDRGYKGAAPSLGGGNKETSWWGEPSPLGSYTKGQYRPGGAIGRDASRRDGPVGSKASNPFR